LSGSAGAASARLTDSGLTDSGLTDCGRPVEPGRLAEPDN